MDPLILMLSFSQWLEKWSDHFNERNQEWAVAQLEWRSLLPLQVHCSNPGNHYRIFISLEKTTMKKKRSEMAQF